MTSSCPVEGKPAAQSCLNMILCLIILHLKKIKNSLVDNSHCSVFLFMLTRVIRDETLTHFPF